MAVSSKCAKIVFGFLRLFANNGILCMFVTLNFPDLQVKHHIATCICTISIIKGWEIQADILPSA